MLPKEDNCSWWWMEPENWEKPRWKTTKQWSVTSPTVSGGQLWKYIFLKPISNISSYCIQNTPRAELQKALCKMQASSAARTERPNLEFAENTEISQKSSRTARQWPIYNTCRYTIPAYLKTHTEMVLWQQRQCVCNGHLLWPHSNRKP